MKVVIEYCLSEIKAASKLRDVVPSYATLVIKQVACAFEGGGTEQ